MLRALKRALAGPHAQNHELPGPERRQLQLAVAVLLHEARRADSQDGRGENDAALHALQDLVALEHEEAQALLEEARAKAQQLTSFYAPVSVIKRDFGQEERIRLIEHLWRVSFADGQLNVYEDHYVRKIAHLLYVHNTHTMLARNRARS